MPSSFLNIVRVLCPFFYFLYPLNVAFLLISSLMCVANLCKTECTFLVFLSSSSRFLIVGSLEMELISTFLFSFLLVVGCFMIKLKNNLVIISLEVAMDCSGYMILNLLDFLDLITE